MQKTCKHLIIVSQLNSDYKSDYHSHSQLCPQCGGIDFSTGSGLKPGKMTVRCSECKAFIGYRNLEKLQRRRRQKSLTPCLELLEKCGVTGDAAVFVLSALGGEG